MLVLGIDTSCDDTCISVIKSEIRNPYKAEPSGYRPKPKTKEVNIEILSNVISSQVKLHAKYGGVWPFLAKREHQKNLPAVFKKALRQAQGKLLRKAQGKQFDLIGVTVGPGLEPCLWQGVNFAKELAKKLKLPIIPVNHIEAHILANWLNTRINTNKTTTPIPNQRFGRVVSPKARIDRPPHPPTFGGPHTNLHENLFPAVCLVVSGGHTQLISMKGIGKYKLIGETRDDAAGECFDKVARILGLGYPGGPIVAAEAARCKVKGLRFRVRLPRPMIYQKNYDFSFSGLKTAVLYDFRNRSPKIRKSKEYIRAMCAEVQQAIIDVLIYKTLKTARNYNTKSIILGGGVAANDELRKQFKSIANSQMSNVNFFAPAKKFCTDNAAMVAVTAYFHQKEATRDFEKIKVNANLKI